MEQAAALANTNDLGDQVHSFVGLPKRALGTTKENQPNGLYVSIDDVPRDLTQGHNPMANSKTYALQESSNATTDHVDVEPDQIEQYMRNSCDQQYKVSLGTMGGDDDLGGPLSLSQQSGYKSEKRDKKREKDIAKKMRKNNQATKNQTCCADQNC